MKFVPEHFGLPAKDPVALKDWYVKMLGAEMVFEISKAPPAFFVGFGPGLMLEIYQAGFYSGETSKHELAGWRHLALRVESIEATRAEMESRGVQFMDPVKPAAGGGRVLFFKDAEGNLLHLVERPKDSVFSKMSL